MDKRDTYRKNRNAWVWAGIVCLIISRAMGAILPFSVLFWLLGVGFVLSGCWYWAKYKGRSGWLTLWGLLAPIGFIPLALMNDKYLEEVSDSSQEQTQKLHEQELRESEEKLAKIRERKVVE